MTKTDVLELTNVRRLLERMRTQLHVWEDEEPESDWWTYQREYAEAFLIIEALTNTHPDKQESGPCK